MPRSQARGSARTRSLQLQRQVTRCFQIRIIAAEADNAREREICYSYIAAVVKNKSLFFRAISQCHASPWLRPLAYSLCMARAPSLGLLSVCLSVVCLASSRSLPSHQPNPMKVSCRIAYSHCDQCKELGVGYWRYIKFSDARIGHDPVRKTCM